MSFSSVFVSISSRRSCNTVTAPALAAENFSFRRQRLKSESLNNTRSAVFMLITGRLVSARSRFANIESSKNSRVGLQLYG